MAKSEEKKEQTVKADLSKYTKTKSASGAASVNNGDPVAEQLDGMDLEEVYGVANSFCNPTDKDGNSTPYDYGHLNGGMQRMNLGNRIRGHVTKIDKANEKAITKAQTAGKDGAVDDKALAKAEKVVSGIDQLVKVCKPTRKDVDARAKEAQKAADAKAKAAEKKAADEAKAEKVKKAA